MTKQQDFDFLFKIVMIGDSGVGKTNLLSRFVDNSFSTDSKPTIGVEFATKTTNIDAKSIKNQIWDTAGQERFRAITNAYYRGAVGAIIAFDLTKSKSFENVQKWLGELRDNAEPRITVMLVGNKSDLTELREVKQQVIQDYINQNRLFYLETSAATGHNVNEAFNQLIKEIYSKQKIVAPVEESGTTQPNQKTPKANLTPVAATQGSSAKKSPNRTAGKTEGAMKLQKKPISSHEKKKSCC